jgi:hypothetical protein
VDELGNGSIAEKWTNGKEYLLQGIVWRDGVPYLDAVDVSSASPRLYTVIDQKFSFRVSGDGHYCLGRYDFVNSTGITHVSCPEQLLAVANAQCQKCAARDEFRFAHQYHLGGFAPDSLRAYMTQPHWVYIATFADSTSKVGTAAEVRKRSRVDEQGAVAATYVARVGDGRLARVVEDAISKDAHLGQTKRRSAKIAALSRPVPCHEVEEEHLRVVKNVLEILEGMSFSAVIERPAERWVPPSAYCAFLDSRSREDWIQYPHSLETGEHAFRVSGCAGPAALARSDDASDAPWYVVDLGGMKGTRVLVGNYAPPVAEVQTSLF